MQNYKENFDSAHFFFKKGFFWEKNCAESHKYAQKSVSACRQLPFVSSALHTRDALGTVGKGRREAGMHLVEATGGLHHGLGLLGVRGIGFT